MLRDLLTELANIPRQQCSEDRFDDTRLGRENNGFVHRHELPLAVSTNFANHHEGTLVQRIFDYYPTEAKPENLVGGRDYDSDKLDEASRKERVEMIAPHCNTRKSQET